MDMNVWLAFLTASFLVSMSPGAGAVNTMNSVVNHGFRSTIPTILGLEVGYGIQILVVAVGLGAILASSNVLFSVIKWIGVGYLIWLGIQKWMSNPTFNPEHEYSSSNMKLFWQSALVNLTNPKATVFLVALLPQFLSSDTSTHPTQLLIMGTTLLVVDVIVMLCYASLASKFQRFITSDKRMRITNRIFGSFFILAALLLSSFKKAT